MKKHVLNYLWYVGMSTLLWLFTLVCTGLVIAIGFGLHWLDTSGNGIVICILLISLFIFGPATCMFLDDLKDSRRNR